MRSIAMAPASASGHGSVQQTADNGDVGQGLVLRLGGQCCCAIQEGHVGGSSRRSVDAASHRKSPPAGDRQQAQEHAHADAYDALAGDRERSLAPGMDDYMTKPVSRARLAAMVERWTGRLDPSRAA